MTRFGSGQLKSAQSVFPVMQNAATRRMKVIPEELPFFDSAIPFVCALGRAMHPNLNNIDATNILIALDTVHLIVHVCMAEDFRSLSDSELTDIVVMTKACCQVLETFKREPLTVKKAHLVVLIDRIGDFLRYIETRDVGDDEKFKKFLKQMVYDAKKCTLYIKAMFKLMFDNTAQEPLTPLLLQFFLDLQPYGLFECLGDGYQDFKFGESTPIEGARALFMGDKDNAHSIFLSVAEQFESESETRQGKGTLARFRAAAAKACGAAARVLADAIGQSTFMFHFQTFGVAEGPTVIFDFAQSILKHLESYERDRGDHQITVQFCESLVGHCGDELIQYLCSAACFYEPYEIGFLALIGAYLPIANQYKLKHLEPFLKVVIALFIKKEKELKAVINEKNPKLASAVEAEFKKLGDVSDLPSAVKSYIVLSAVFSAMLSAEVADDRTDILITTLGRLLIAWIVCLAALLRDVVIKFVPNAISTIEKNKSISREQLDHIHESFDQIAVFDLSLITPHVISELLELVHSCMYGILPLVEDLIQAKPLSLATTEKEFVALLKFSEVALKYFELLQGAVVTFEFQSSIYRRHQILSFIQPSLRQLEPIPQYVAAQSDQIRSLLLQTRVGLAPSMVGLASVDRSVDIKGMTDNIRNMTDSKDPAVIIANHDQLKTQLETAQSQASAVELDKSALDMIDTTSNKDIEGLIKLISNPTLQAASFELLPLLDTPSASVLRTEKRDNLLGILALRVHGFQQYDLSKLLTLSDDEIYASSLNIVATLPLYAGDNWTEVQSMTVPLMLREDKVEMRLALTRIVKYLTVGASLLAHCRRLVMSLASNGEGNVNSDIDDVLRQLQLNIQLYSNNRSPRIQSIYNIGLLYAESQSYVTLLWNGRYLDSQADKLFALDSVADVDRVEAIVLKTMHECLMTAVVKRCFHPEVLQALRGVWEALKVYRHQPNMENHRLLYGRMLHLPVVFYPQGEVNKVFVEVIAYILSITMASLKNDLGTLLSIIEGASGSLDRALSLVPVDDPVDIVEREVKITPPPKIIPRPPKEKKEKKEKKQVAPEDLEPIVEVRMLPQRTERIHRHLHKHKSGRSSKSVTIEKQQSKTKIMQIKIAPQPRVIRRIIKKPRQVEPFCVRVRVRREHKKEEKETTAQTTTPTTPTTNTTPESISIRCVRLIEASRDATQALEALNTAIVETKSNEEITKCAEEVSTRGTRFYEILTEAPELFTQLRGPEIAEALNQIILLTNSVLSGDRSQVENMEQYVMQFRHTTQEMLRLFMQAQGLANIAAIELGLLTSRAESLQAQLEKDDYEAEAGDNELWRLVAREAKELLKMTKNLGREAQAQSEYLMEINETVTNERGLINACLQTSDACQMFFLLLRLFKINDKDVKFKVIAACAQMRAGLASIIVNLRAKGGSKEISKRIEAIAEKIFERLNIVREAAEKSPHESMIERKDVKAGMNLIIQKRNAADVVFRMHREVEEAEEEVKRLNRMQSRR